MGFVDSISVGYGLIWRSGPTEKNCLSVPFSEWLEATSVGSIV